MSKMIYNRKQFNTLKERIFCDQLLDTLAEYQSLGIADQIDYKKSQEDDPIKERLYQAVLQNGTLNYAEYAAIVGTSEATVKRRLGELKKEGAIIRVGSNKTGHWEINKEK